MDSPKVTSILPVKGHRQVRGVILFNFIPESYALCPDRQNLILTAEVTAEVGIRRQPLLMNVQT